MIFRAWPGRHIRGTAFRSAEFRRRSEYDADRTAGVHYVARRCERTAFSIDPERDDAVAVLVRSEQQVPGWPECKESRRFAFGCGPTAGSEATGTRFDCEGHDAVVASIRGVQKPAIAARGHLGGTAVADKGVRQS